MRRVFDIIAASIGLIVLSPLFAVLALAITIEDRGPVFYAHRRIGRNFRPFGILKFRSMVVGADQLGSPITPAGDQRITRVGCFLRRYKLDELPQLVNILKGEMRFVGPRAEIDRYVQLFRAEYSMLLRDRPGITDPAALAFRNEEANLAGADVEHLYVAEILPQKLRLSLDYAQRRTFLTDVLLVLRTVMAIFGPSSRPIRGHKAQAA